MIGYVTLGSNDLPRAFAFYDALLADWRGTTAAIAATIGIAWTPPTDAGAAIDAFLAPALRHQLPATGTAGSLARRLHAAAATADEPAIRAAFDAVRSILDEHDRLLAPWQSAWRTRLAALEAQTHTQADELAQRHALLAAYEHSTSWRLTRPLRAFMHLFRP